MLSVICLSKLKNSELITYVGMGHGLPMQLWSEFANRIANLIQRVESYR